MGTTFFPDYPDVNGWMIDVPNPGYGEILVDSPHTGSADRWHTDLNGHEIGNFLAQVTRRALGHDGPTDMLPAILTADVAATILPALQQAAILATAGTDRYERTYRNDADPPAEPLCSNCDDGTIYAPRESNLSDWCARYGHHPFGHGPNARWAEAQALYEQRRARWEQRREHTHA